MNPEHTRPPAPSKAGLDPLLADTLFLLGHVLAYLGVMALLRGLLLYTNIDLADKPLLAI